MNPSSFFKLDLTSQTSDMFLLPESTDLKKTRSELIWTTKQNLAYLEFLKQNSETFKNQRTRRSQKVFEQLSKIINSRSADQCRTHHLKMIQTHKNISKIIRNLERKIKKILSHQNSTKERVNNDSCKSHQNIPLKKPFNEETEMEMCLRKEDENLIWKMVDDSFWESEQKFEFEKAENQNL